MDYTVSLARDGRVVGSARVVTSPDLHGTATVAFHGLRGDDLPPDARGDLVDKVLDQPEVANSDHLHAVVPLGDSALITQLQHRLTGFSAHPAGASAIVDATIPTHDISTDILTVITNGTPPDAIAATSRPVS